jgi:hypothetical protein
VSLILRMLGRLADQGTARSNAALASALLRERRSERDGVEAYLVRRRS